MLADLSLSVHNPISPPPPPQQVSPPNLLHLKDAENLAIEKKGLYYFFECNNSRSETSFYTVSKESFIVMGKIFVLSSRFFFGLGSGANVM